MSTIGLIIKITTVPMAPSYLAPSIVHHTGHERNIICPSKNQAYFRNRNKSLIKA